MNYLIFLFIFVRVVSIPAWAALLWWFGWQVVSGLPQLSPMRPEVSGGVAVWAHIGGFATGALLVKAFENRQLVARRRMAFAALGVPPG